MPRLDPLVSQIDATWFGAGLSPASQQFLADLAREYAAPAGTRLLQEGAETRELSLLLHGRLLLTEHVPGRGPVTLLTIEPGDIFGWSALIAPFRATSTVTVTEPATVIAFEAARLRYALHQDVQLAAGIYQQVLEAVARRLLATRQQLLDVYDAGTERAW